MEDSKENTVSIRIYEETQTSMLEEQARRKRATGAKPSFADLVCESWSKLTRPEHLDHSSGIAGVDSLSLADRQIVTNLMAMIRDGETEKLPSVRLLLKTYKPKVQNVADEAAPKSGKHRRSA